MKLAALFLLTLAAAGCASTADLQAALHRLVGQPESALRERYGEPDEQRNADGQRWLTWTTEERSFSEGYWRGFENDSTYLARCQISARVQDAKVVQVLQKGILEDCRSLGMI